MDNEEHIYGAGVEVEFEGPENNQPQLLDAIVVEPEPAAEIETVALAEPAHVAAVEPVPMASAASAAAAPDFYAVGVRLIKMSPVWLLTVTGGFALLIFILSWIRPAGDAASAASMPNDAKSVVVQAQPAPAAKPVEVTPAPVAPPATQAPAQTSAETHDVKPVEVASVPPVSPAPAPAEAPKQAESVETTASGANGKFTIQVASFKVESQANERISTLRAAGFDARLTAAELPGRGKWFRVHVGRFAEREEAAKVVAQLRAKGAAESSMVVPVQ